MSLKVEMGSIGGNLTCVWPASKEVIDERPVLNRQVRPLL